MHTKQHFIGAVLTGLFVLTAFFLTMAPTVTFWDAGEFIAAAFTLGIPHPPGTPLFVNIGRVICSLPLPFEIAPRLNFLSVLCGTVTAVFIFLIAAHLLEKLTRGEKSFAARFVVLGGAAAAAIVPSFLYTAWTNTTEFEVYAVATATILLCSWLTLRMGAVESAARTQRTVLLLIYLVALSIANHLIVLLAAPAVVLYVLLLDSTRRAYWLSVICSMTGLYLLVLKGIDLDKVGLTLDKHHAAGPLHLGTILWSLAAGLPDVLVSLGAHVQSWKAFIIGLLVCAVSFWWANRQRALGFVGLASGLFLLGFSIHLYLLIRSGFHPAINEGGPDNFAAFWSVIGREQYGSAYGILPRQAWTVITGKTAIGNLNDLVDNIRVFFVHNVPFYTKYFSMQFGNTALSAVFFLVGLYGAFTHWKSDRKSFWFWLTVFLVTGMVLNIYMNFKLEFTLARDKYPADAMHEVRERDYFFIISYVFFGMWAGLGLAGLANRVRLALCGREKTSWAGGAVFALLGVLLLCTSFIPMAKNWSRADRSGNYIPRVYARNIMNSLEKDAILMTNGDNDTFPLWYIQEVEGVRKDCRIMNLSLINVPWYIRQMRDQEPRLPISYNDSTLDQLYGFVLNKPMRFLMDSVQVDFNKGEVMYVKDIIVLDLIRNNRWKRPIYYTTTTPAEARTKLDPYLVMQGMTFRLYPEKASSLAARNPSIAGTLDANIFVDIPRTDSLYRHVYKYDTFFRQDRMLEGEEAQTIIRTGNPLMFLSIAQAVKGNYAAAAETRLEMRKFWQYGGILKPQLDFTIGGLLLEAGQAGRALQVFDSLSMEPKWYSELAQASIQKGNVEVTKSILHHIIERKPAYREGYAHLFMLESSLGRQDSAIAAMQMYMKQFPADTLVPQEIERYRASGEFNLTRTFNISPPKQQ